MIKGTQKGVKVRIKDDLKYCSIFFAVNTMV